ncbi:MAG: sugar ABC transporter substrate-binding protein, partial [Elusimicrobia bacterium]|nr:sugar ABC transporter substrate-binding protein [Elusimicrobiota bacterium]
LKSSSNPFVTMEWEGIKSEADRLGIEVDLYWPEFEHDFAYQAKALRGALSKDYDALILAPSNPASVGPLLVEWKRAGKAVIVLDEPVPLPPGTEPGKVFDSFIGTDNTAGGRLAGKYAEHFVKSGDHVAVVSGFDFEMRRTRSFKAFLQSRYPQIHIREFKGQFERTLTRAIVRDNLRYFQTAAAVFCANDHMALGVVDAFKAAGTKRWPAIIGYDSIKEAQVAILRGDIRASIIQAPAKMGSQAVAMLPRIMAGEPFARETLIPPELTTVRPAIVHLKESELASLLAEPVDISQVR